MNNFGNWLGAIIKFKSLIFIKSIVAFVIIAIFGFLHMAIFGEDTRMSTVGSLILFIGSCVLANIIVNAISRKLK